MIRFIDLSDQIIDGEKEFAFYDTVIDTFKIFSGCQTWDTIEDFKNDYVGEELERYLNKIPEDFFEENYQKTTVKFILETQNKKFELYGYASPRGLRENDKRPHKITIQVIKSMEIIELKKHIDYLIELYQSMNQNT